jgi:hypothetical protein
MHRRFSVVDDGLPLLDTVPRREWPPSRIRSLLHDVSGTRDASTTEVDASVDTWADGVAEYADRLRELGLDAGMYDALRRLFTATAEAGLGDADWTCVADHVATSWVPGRCRASQHS